jgi:glutathione S-transferase
MAKDLIFYTNPMSRGRIVRWMLEEVGAPYETVILDYASSLKGAEYLAINPMGKIPAIKHGDTVVTEGAAICAYLADAFPQAGLAPPVPTIAGCSSARARWRPRSPPAAWASSPRPSRSARLGSATLPTP